MDPIIYAIKALFLLPTLSVRAPIIGAQIILNNVSIRIRFAIVVAVSSAFKL